MSWLIIPEPAVIAAKAHLPDSALDGIKFMRRTLRGTPLTIVKHDYETFKTLRDRGMLAPNPMVRYHYPGRFTPMEHQRRTAEFFLEHDKCFCTNGLRCVDSETEYLSPTGWRKISEYESGQVAQYDPDTGGAAFVEPLEYVKSPCDQMVRIKTTKGVDQLVSLGHRVLIKAADNPDKYEVLPAVELLKRHEQWLADEKPKKSQSRVGFSQAAVPATFRHAGGRGIPLSDAALRLQVAVMADGHFNNKSNTVVIRLKRPRKITRLRSLLGNACVAFSESVAGAHRTDAGFHIFSFPAPWRCKEFDERFWEAAPAQREIIADEVAYWDGSRRKAGAVAFSTTSKASADFVQYCFSSTGRVASVLIDNREYKSGKCYTVYARRPGNNLRLKSTSVTGKNRTLWLEPATDGHQYCFRVPSKFLLFRRNGCVFASGNTGKTLSAVWAADYLQRVKVVRRVLIVAPLSICDIVWERELFQTLPGKRSVLIKGDRARKQALAEDTRFDFIIVNPESLGLIEDHLADVDLVIVDEFTKFKNYRAQRYKVLKRVAERRRLVMMSATPAPQRPTDAYGPIRLVNPRKLGYKQFESMTMIQLSKFKWINKKECDEVIAQWMQPSIRFKREDCIEIPEVSTETLQAGLTDKQKELIKAFADKAVTQMEGTRISAPNAAAVLTKTLQVMAGGVYGFDEQGERVTHEVDAEPYFEAIENVVEQAEGPVLIFCSFQSSVVATYNRLVKQGYRVAKVMSGVTGRMQIFDAVQRGELDALVAIPDTMSHGLNLSRSNTVLWAQPPFSFEVYDQANHRVMSSDQKSKVLVLHLIQNGLSSDLFKRLETRQKLQDAVLTLLEQSGAL